LSVSVLYGFLFSLPEGLGVPVAPDSPWPPLRALHGWAVAEEPAHLDPPPNLVAACSRRWSSQRVSSWGAGASEARGARWETRTPPFEPER
jgi:hypothetical protein